VKKRVATNTIATTTIREAIAAAVAEVAVAAVAVAVATAVAAVQLREVTKTLRIAKMIARAAVTVKATEMPTMLMIDTEVEEARDWLVWQMIATATVMIGAVLPIPKRRAVTEKAIIRIQEIHSTTAAMVWAFLLAVVLAAATAATAVVYMAPLAKNPRDKYRPWRYVNCQKAVVSVLAAFQETQKKNVQTMASISRLRRGLQPLLEARPVEMTKAPAAAAVAVAVAVVAISPFTTTAIATMTTMALTMMMAMTTHSRRGLRW